MAVELEIAKRIQVIVSVMNQCTGRNDTTLADATRALTLMLPVLYENGHRDGYSEGYELGKTDGIQEGYETGIGVGRTQGEKISKSIIDRTIDSILTDASAIGAYSFYKCLGLKDVSAPFAISVGNYAFYGCSSLETALFEKATTIYTQTFAGCSRLKTIIAPLVTYIDDWTFHNCASLESVKFENVSRIDESAFHSCKGLVYADFQGSSGSKIYGKAFYGCENLKELVLRSTKMYALDNITAFEGTKIAKGEGFIYVPKSLISAYKSATNWSALDVGEWRALEDYTDNSEIGGELSPTRPM